MVDGYTCIFNTATRSEYGLFYLDFIRAADLDFFCDPDNPVIIAMVGSRGKSLAADIVFHEALDHLDPMDIIDGEECRHMYLEEKPRDAIHRALFDHGSMTQSDQSKVDLSLMFVNQPIPDIFDRRYYDKTITEKDAVVAQCLRSAFREKRRGPVGGLIFASGFGTFDHADVTISMEGGAHKDWKAEHTVFVNSKEWQQSERFNQGWAALKAKYESRSVLEWGM